MIEPLEIGNVGTIPENLEQAQAVISAQQDSQIYQGDQQIQANRQPKLTQKGREYRCLLWRTSVLSWFPDISRSPAKLMI